MTKKKILIIAAVIGVICFIFFIAGIIFFVQGRSKSQPQTSSQNYCSFSDEAKRIGLDGIIQKVQNKYFELFPELYIHKPGAKDIKKHYKVSDFTPAMKKRRTDVAREMYRELVANLDYDSNKLKQREKKALSQLGFFLNNSFSSSGYDGDYYTGVWMMGPDTFCYHTICYLDYDIYNNLYQFAPSNVEEMEKFKDILIDFNKTFSQIVENLKLGVRAGMVPPVEVCKSGYSALGARYPKVFSKGAQGIYEESYVQDILNPNFLHKMVDNDVRELLLWRQKYNVKVQDSLRNYVLEYLGKPIANMFRYLREEYQQHCVPSSVSSGYSSLPVPYIYVNGTPDLARPTTGRLPTGEKLNGAKTFEYILKYFTTTSLSPDEVYRIGNETLHALYPQALVIAREVTGQKDNELAKKQFKARLNSSDMYYSDVIPKNESGSLAKQLCTSTEKAKEYCPTRWAAMEKWFTDARQTMAKLDGKIVDMFYFTGSKKTTPSCPASLEPDFLPDSGAQSYQRSDAECSHPATYMIPFFMDRMGPRFEEWSVNAHEVMPGHHLQDQGNIENFMDPCKGSIAWIQSTTVDAFSAFVEGWGLYAENPLVSNGTTIYNNKPFYRYGMLKWQIWRALRLIVDTGLHYRNMTRAEAIKLFEDYAWDSGDSVTKEITRYQGVPGQASSYMIGRRLLTKIRSFTEKELGEKFKLKDFHFQVLSQGSAPLSYYEDHIDKYVKCVKSPAGECSNILSPPKVAASKETQLGVRKDFVMHAPRVMLRGKPAMRRYK